MLQAVIQHEAPDSALLGRRPVPLAQAAGRVARAASRPLCGSSWTRRDAGDLEVTAIRSFAIYSTSRLEKGRTGRAFRRSTRISTLREAAVRRHERLRRA